MGFAGFRGLGFRVGMGARPGEAGTSLKQSRRSRASSGVAKGFRGLGFVSLAIGEALCSQFFVEKVEDHFGPRLLALR